MPRNKTKLIIFFLFGLFTITPTNGKALNLSRKEIMCCTTAIGLPFVSTCVIGRNLYLEYCKVTHEKPSFKGNMSFLKKLIFNKQFRNSVPGAKKFIAFCVTTGVSTIGTALYLYLRSASAVLPPTAQPTTAQDLAKHHLHINSSGILSGVTRPNDKNDFVDADVQWLATSDYKNVTELKFSQCHQLNDKGLSYLVQVPNLITLDLSGCYHVTDKGLEHLAKLPNLTTLDLSYCGQITDKGLAHLLSLNDLRLLFLTDCKKPTNESKKALKARFSNLCIDSTTSLRFLPS
jgi:hypothetical protein